MYIRVSPFCAYLAAFFACAQLGSANPIFRDAFDSGTGSWHKAYNSADTSLGNSAGSLFFNNPDGLAGAYEVIGRAFDPQSLAVGETITLSFDFTPTNVTGIFRVGLHDLTGVTVSSDGWANSSAGSYAGYATFVRSDGSNVARAESAPFSKDHSNGYPTHMVNGASDIGGSTEKHIWVNGTSYRISFAVTRVAASRIHTLLTVLDGTTTRYAVAGGQSIDTNFHTFDSACIRIPNGSALLDNIEVTVIAAPSKVDAATEDKAPVVSAIPATTQAEAQYQLARKDADTAIVTKTGAGAVDLDMKFTIFFATNSPEMSLRNASVPGLEYTVPTWTNKALKGADASIKQMEDFLSVGDGFDPEIQKGSKDNRTADLFKSAPNVTLSADQSVETAAGIEYRFPEHPMFKLEASLTLPDPTAAPVLTYRFTPKKSGYYSVGYVGAPAHAVAAVEDIWQPLVWQEKRFPHTSFMELAFRCPVPTTLVTHKGLTLGMVVDPDFYPFDELPTFTNSRFGVAVRNRDGLAQPMTFAPVLGSVGSQMAADKTFEFKLRPMLVKGNTVDAFADIATSLYGFRDYRSNSIGSLNRALDNMIDYGMSEWSRFHVDEKGCNYSTDAPGSVKNVSSLNPLELALITDDEQIFEERAYPLIEYMLSRGKFLFTVDRTQKIQSPSYTLSGPTAPISELATLYKVFGKQTNSLLELAKKEYEGKRARNLDAVQSGRTWPNAMGLYQMTGDKSYLDFAMKGADQYIKDRIETPQTDFKDPFGDSMFFWTEYNPRFAWLLELYELTGEKRYLDAAHKSARRFTQQVWMSPKIPDKEITVNPGGKAPHYWYLKGKGHKQMLAPKESVPAWRLSTIGLTPESSGTSAGHRAIFMANHAPWLIRIGALTGDEYLRAAGRSAIVGRYMNFPGYHVNTARTTIYEKADYPLRPHKELGVNSMHYNHIWPMMSMVVDYLVSETMARSDGAIDFPSHFIEGYAYMQNKFYGAQKGRFFDAQDAVLWMPKNLVQADSPEVNYIAARGDDSVYLALLNESDKAITTQVTLNAKLLPEGTYPVRVKEGADAFKSAGTSTGTLTVTIPARGLTAVVLDNCKIQTRFQQKMMEGSVPGAWKHSLIDMEEPKGRAMILNLGSDTTRAFIYLIDDASTFNEVRISYDIGKGQEMITDKVFPWEFTLPLDTSVNKVSFSISGLDKKGQMRSGKTYQLSKD